MADEAITDEWLKIGRDYLAYNAAESGADIIIDGLCREVERLRGCIKATTATQEQTQAILEDIRSMLRDALNGR